mgnify:CR=1 FL=1
MGGVLTVRLVMTRTPWDKNKSEPPHEIVYKFQSKRGFYTSFITLGKLFSAFFLFGRLRHVRNALLILRDENEKENVHGLNSGVGVARTNGARNIVNYGNFMSH